MGKSDQYYEKFMLSRIKKDLSGCWLWCGTLLDNGYGRVMKSGNPVGAHRMSLYLWRGFSLTSDLIVCHRCNNPRCINPEHLYAGTPRSNALDAIAAGNWVDNNGEKSGLARLTNENAMTIRKRYRAGEMQKDLATEYGVHKNTIWRIINDKTYRK